jgi:mandelate racemase
MPDLQRMGGVTGYLRAVDVCEAYQTPVSSHLFVEISGHVVAAAAHASLLEHMDWWVELFDARLPIEDGHVVLPDRPGLGVGLDRKALERFRA